ncbi:MAG TPA: SMP-30/gluconolactonase/LRE family protein [Acidobacteriota bacterium]|nr:SMP-30/gluconolactonase/LRE family protein [Acidobacteriota bacterium]HNH81843.1 SMP-30/gluconolactonase/LRE family protein [Acidobacteriota bacterium]
MRILSLGVGISLLLGIAGGANFAYVNGFQSDKPLVTTMECYQVAGKSLQEKDYRTGQKALERALQLGSSHPRFIYRLAVAQTQVGDTAGALARLKQLAGMQVEYPLETDADLATLKPNPDFQTVVAAFEKNRKPVSQASVAFTIGEKDLIPEGITWDPVDRVYFVGSIYKRKILKIDQAGKATEFVPSGQDGLGPVIGLKVDPKRRWLWACSAYEKRGDAPLREDGGIFKYDLRTGKLLQKYLLKNQPVAHFLNDLALDAQGGAFVTDSETGSVYVIRPGKNELELFVQSPELIYPNGLALTPDGNQLFVAQYDGIILVDVVTKKLSRLTHPETVTVAGIDGLSLNHRSLIAVQNSFEPHRVIRFDLNSKLNRVERAEVLEARNPHFVIPTTGTMAGNEYVVLANSQLDRLGPDGNLTEPEKLKAVVGLRIRLKK